MTAHKIAGVLGLLLLLAWPVLAQAENAASAVPAAPETPETQDTPDTVVVQVNETLLGTMRDAESLGFQGRYDRLAPVFTAAFQFPYMARVAAGSYWRDLGPEQREQLAGAFAHMSVATYAARFDGYSGQSFKVVETVEQPRGGALVRNRLIKGDGEVVAIDYLLREFDGRWRIVDVFLDGTISEIATKRSEYTSILHRDGFAGLLARISSKTAELAAQ